MSAPTATRDGKGLWIGTTTGLWHKKNNRGVVKVGLLPRPAVLEVTDLLEDREGNIWVGTWGGGVFQIPPTSWTHFTRETGFPAQSAWSFSEDSQGCVWMATTDAGVISWCGDRWGERLTAANGLPSSTVYSVTAAEPVSVSVTVAAVRGATAVVELVPVPEFVTAAEPAAAPAAVPTFWWRHGFLQVVHR